MLASNSHRAKWKVISPSGNEAMVPSVCFTVPPPNKEATEMASRWASTTQLSILSIPPMKSVFLHHSPLTTVSVYLACTGNTMLCPPSNLLCLFNVNRFHTFVSAFRVCTFFPFDQNWAAVSESSRTLAPLSREHEECRVLALPDDGYPQPPEKHCCLCKHICLYKWLT